MTTVEFDDEEPAADPPEMVRICTQCGRGFPSWGPSSPVDAQAIWWIVIDNAVAATSPPCNGRIITVNRQIHIENVANALLKIQLAKKMEGRPL